MQISTVFLCSYSTCSKTLEDANPSYDASMRVLMHFHNAVLLPVPALEISSSLSLRPPILQYHQAKLLLCSRYTITSSRTD